MQPSGERYDIEDLKNIMAQLRAPQGGCPWDQKQTFKSIAKYTIEEAYEVVDAIERDDHTLLCEELGDLLFQTIYHAQMAKEKGSFEFDDVIHTICEKLVRRHPHVFANETLTSDEEIAQMWEREKRKEKAASLVHNNPSLLSDVPVGMTALTRAVKLQKKAAQIGFDWPDKQPVLEKIQEELDELTEALNDQSPKGQAHQQEEFGDMLFVMANLARHLKIDPETALRGANEKFCRRFGFIEQTYNFEREKLEAASLKEMDALWDEAKRLEK